MIELLTALVVTLLTMIGGASETVPQYPVDALVEVAGTCHEDEVVVVIVAEVAPDNGAEPDVDWTQDGRHTGKYGCVVLDDINKGYRP